MLHFDVSHYRLPLTELSPTDKALIATNYGLFPVSFNLKFVLIINS